MRRFVRLAIQNWQLKLLAVALAILLWVVVSAEQVSTSWIDVPFTVQESDPDFQLLPGSVPERVRVRFTGPGREFIDLAVRRPSVLLRVGEVRDDEQAFQLLPAMVRLPDGLEVTARDIDPAFARLRFRRLASRDLPVGVAIDNAGRGDWTLVGPLRVAPSRVRIRGPAERIPSVLAISTEPLRIPQIEGSFEQEVALDLSALRGLETSSQTVRVSGRSERIVNRLLREVDISVGPGVVIGPEQAVVRLRGARSAVDSIDPGAFRVVLAIDSIPSQLPEAGLMVPLRIEGISPSIRATIEPASVQLLPAAATAPDSAATPDGNALRASESAVLAAAP